ncbi:hypothetical protein [Catellatospora chokoriensis]|nr:hypothetical protein [Catellatospora chokoriensis]
MPKTSGWWHADAYRLMDLRPEMEPELVARLDDLERHSGLRLPAAVREWYSVGAAQRRLAERRQNPLTTTAELGEPRDRIDHLAHGRLITETDCQYCCHWVVRLAPWPDGTEPLFPLPGAASGPDDDPPVWVIDPDDRDVTLMPYADRFSDYLLTSVWDSCEPADAFSGFDLPLPPHALDVLRQRYQELPTTYSWAGNQGCDAMYRFDGAARVLIAVAGEIALYVVVSTTDPRHEAELRSLFGL